ncbi:MAG: UDP-3-O-(3-hydroxymyristoyl)glucosamine N-acyltransferase [Phycisphaerae bacterium]|nr:UDP-3-O-(3-hydroxymyristoyl)glucosamine N-acyltransferase [Phycisphaerae bacterium]
MTVKRTLAELAEIVGGEVRGDGGLAVTGVAAIDQAGPDDVTWVADPRYAEALAKSRAGAVVAANGFEPTPMPAILCEDPETAIALILECLAPPVWCPEPGIHPTAVVAGTAQLGQDVSIGPYAVVGERSVIGDRTSLHAHVVIGPDVTIGSDCAFWPHVVVRERSEIGSRVIVHPQVSIGCDGYGYRFAEGRHHRIPQTGNVRIEDDVEIGAGSCIDRAKVGTTVIGQGTKIDNLVQIAHNVEIGPHCLLVAQVGIAGTAKLGPYVVLGGKVGVRDHVSVGPGTKVAACSCIAQDVPAGVSLAGIPARDGQLWLRQQVLLDRFPQLHAHIRRLEKRVASLETAADHQQGG